MYYSLFSCIRNPDSVANIQREFTKISDPCILPEVIGPCSGFVKQFYYDRRSDSCYEFEYSGCQGNKNRFQDRESCERKCKRGTAPITPATIDPRIGEPKSQICLAPVDPGDCDDSITAYYYDAQHEMCQAFIYGGCSGNANRFQTEEQCERLCGRFHGQGKLSSTYIVIFSNKIFLLSTKYIWTYI